jgi:hypothetical protein
MMKFENLILNLTDRSLVERLKFGFEVSVI